MGGALHLAPLAHKAGSTLNLLRWVPSRTIEETGVPPTGHRHPFLDEEQAR